LQNLQRVSKASSYHYFTVKVEAQMVSKALRNIPMRCRIPKQALTKDRQIWCNSCAYHSSDELPKKNYWLWIQKSPMLQQVWQLGRLSA
jgi:hypothetical protein